MTKSFAKSVFFSHKGNEGYKKNSEIINYPLFSLYPSFPLCEMYFREGFFFYLLLP